MIYIDKTAFITGITGQDGSYLAELLLSKGYTVHALIRRASTSNTSRIDPLLQKIDEQGLPLYLHLGDLSDGEQISNIIFNLRPDEVYNLAAQSHVRVSYDCPAYTGDVTGIGAARILEAIRNCDKDIRYYQASSSEMFGSTRPPQNEQTVFHPRSPYACAKVYAHYLTQNYRESYNLFACSGILFNHESPRRGENFVTRKITRGIASILAGRQKSLVMGNLDAKRDWGYSPEYVQAMWMMLQQDKPDDYVIGTGESHSVREFLEIAFDYVGLDWQKYVKFDQKFFRPAEVDDLIADTRKAEAQLGWKPNVTFQDLMKIMVDSDMREIGLEPIGDGDEILARIYPDRWWTVD